MKLPHRHIAPIGGMSDAKDFGRHPQVERASSFAAQDAHRDPCRMFPGPRRTATAPTHILRVPEGTECGDGYEFRERAM